MSTGTITATRGLPDGSAIVPYRVTFDTDTAKPLGHEGLVGDTWLPWPVIVDSLGWGCVCGGSGYRGPEADWETGEVTKKGSLLPCLHCTNGETRRQWLNSRNRR